jgi:hypothetical protein
MATHWEPAQQETSTSGADGSIVAAIHWSSVGALEVYTSPPDTATHRFAVAHETLGIALVRALTSVGLLQVKLAARAAAGASRIAAAQTQMTVMAARTMGKGRQDAVQRMLRGELSVKPVLTLTHRRTAHTG